MRRDALKEVELARFSRLATRISCRAAPTTVVLVAWVHQNCHGLPHSDPGSPCSKGRAIYARGHHAAVRLSRAERRDVHARFSRLATRVSCKAAHTTVVAVAWEHQNCHGTPHFDQGSPITKGRATDVRGHHATVWRSRALIQTSPSSIDRVMARPLAANLPLQPCSACVA